ncbi:PilW family protein [Coraliomargarita akajimensis]|uniref:Prepilin-type N-terminal cleavage/methylation domain-containing protein n=1 Tax=Coraliomargarita akajimensis (strain DSM 45221 / IAM 15411 / JCM 23193 / KCTC 12865 / 04OKA010-24) TaxID=583355 RepID=D5EJN9_CORAD|nr:prepilin-type N-terminal cleavage/methylation domain-containing protein [Coraliomargarita akajimensis]ADE54638.1 hypothetical protein Caka_1619 [Coraliomargarita akajimensis DSM 45221]
MTFSTKRVARSLGRQGFTLVELLVTATLLGLVIAGTVSISIFFLKSNYSLGSAVVMLGEERLFIEQLGQDLRSANAVTNAQTNQLTLSVEDPGGSTSTVVYAHSASSGVTTRQVDSGKARQILSNVSSITYRYYDASGGQVSGTMNVAKLASIKRIEVGLEQSKNDGGRQRTESLTTTRFLLRRK